MLRVLVITGDDADEVAKLSKLLVGGDPIALHQLALKADGTAYRAETVAETLDKLQS
jgi:hypothetical protein